MNFEIITKEELGDFDEDDAKLESFQTSEISTALDEEVFDSWDEAEEAFMGFDKDEDTAEEETDWTETETEQSESTVREDLSEKGDKFSFNEDELKDIVTSSVQNALEKSIASSLVELAVSELKNQVSRKA